MNEEATMSRRGLDPVSRKTRTPGGRKKAGFCVYLAYQLLGPYHVQLRGAGTGGAGGAIFGSSIRMHSNSTTNIFG